MPPRDSESSTTIRNNNEYTKQQRHHNEATPLTKSHMSFENDNSNSNSGKWASDERRISLIQFGCISLLLSIFVWFCSRQYYIHSSNSIVPGTSSSTTTTSSATSNHNYPSGPYHLVDRQVGKSFLDSYDFFDGPDSIGSAGYNVYVNRHRAEQIGIVNVTASAIGNNEYIFMKSSSTTDGPRESIRLEGKTRYNNGLFIADVQHMPVGCGQWPAFWLTDDNTDAWPNHGEIDIIEGINYQNYAKTALHTSNSCSMWQQVSPLSKSGQWDRADGLFDRYTGIPQNDSNIPADNCYVKATHQWSNQGCVTISDKNNTLGTGINNQEGGIYVLEWDPYNGYIRSWVFPRSQGIPSNLQVSIDNSQNKRQQPDDTTTATTVIDPDDDSWGLPYAYFAIGDHSDCSNDHFQNMRLIFNLAFCGTVSGNRFFNDCPAISKMYSTNPNLQYDPIGTCNAYIQSNPTELNDAYWQINGVYVYQRT